MLLRHSSDMLTQEKPHLRDGKGTVTVEHILNPDELSGKGRLFAIHILPPGASIGLHPHDGEIEAYHFLAGKGRYWNNEEVFDVVAGDTTLVDDHNSHGVENTGDTPLKFIGLILFTGK
ncbi:cupin [Betaproteobacteria bacterium]|nr:cupin [Betaproteobacteria bacterium]